MRRIGEILVGARAITEKVRDETLAYMKTHRVCFGTAILEGGGISEDALLRALSVQTGAPPVGGRDLAAVPPDVIRLVPQKLAEKHAALPFRKVGRTLYIAMSHPRNNPGADEIAFLTGLSVIRHVAISARLSVALEKYYGIVAPAGLKELVAKLDGSAGAPQTGHPPPGGEPPDRAPVLDSSEIPVAKKLASGLFRIPLSEGPADPWKLASEPMGTAVEEEEMVIDTQAPAARSRSVLEPLDFIPDHSGEEPESAGVPLPEDFPRSGDPREVLRGTRPPQAVRAKPVQKAEASADALAKRLAEAEGTEEVGMAILDSLRKKLDTVALFLVQGERVAGWLVRPEPPEYAKDFSVPFSEPSFFSGLRNTTGFFAGPCPDTAANRKILESIGLRFPVVLGVVPVTVRGKTILFLLGEAVGGARALQIPVLRRHASMTALALEILALRRKLAAL
jgi:hypothetical protein